MKPREEWDVIGKFVDATILSNQARKHDDGTDRTPREFAEFVVRTLANPDYPAANAAWDALAEERRKRQEGR